MFFEAGWFAERAPTLAGTGGLRFTAGTATLPNPVHSSTDCDLATPRSCLVMGCSSSKGSRSGIPDTEDLVTGVPKMGIHDNGNGKDELDDKNSKVHTLLLKKNQRSIQGRPNQVRGMAFVHCGFLGVGGVCGLERKKKSSRFVFFVFLFVFCIFQFVFLIRRGYFPCGWCVLRAS